MTSHQHSVIVDKPLPLVYDQWTQFESYPLFMQNVDEVKQVSDTLTHWRIRVGGVSREYDAQILEQRPDEIISWASVDGPRNAGVVTFAPSVSNTTRVTLQLDFEPQGVTERAGEAFGVVSGSVEGSLHRFKEYIEHRDVPSGSWRGSVDRGEVVGGEGDADPGPGPAAPTMI